MGLRLPRPGPDGAVFLLALALRGLFLLFWELRGWASLHPPDAYYSIALSWLGHAPPLGFDAMLPPFYTLFLSAVLGLSGGPDPLLARGLQCALGAASAVLLRRIGLALAGERAALWAGLWAAADPALIFFTPHLQTETLFVFLELGFFLALLPKARAAALDGTLPLIGLLGGLCALTRSVFTAYPAFLFLALWRSAGLKRALLFSLLLGAGWALPGAVWTARNLAVYGKLVPMSAQMGWTLWEGFTLDREEVRRRPHDMAEEAAARGISDPADLGGYFLAKTRAFARERPFEALKIVVGKAFLYWRPFPYDPHSWWIRGGLGAYYLALFGFALLGARRAWGQPGWGPVWALFAYLTAMHSVFFTSLRYRVPLEPFLCLLAALGAAGLYERRARAR